jgi:hypothetical protein
VFGNDCSDLMVKIEDVYGMVSRSRLGQLSFPPLSFSFLFIPERFTLGEAT